MASSNSIIEGVESIILQRYMDGRGNLIVLEEHQELPFIPRRIFYITQPVNFSKRGCHSGNSEELIAVIHGSVSVDLDNSMQQTTINLNTNSDALWIRPGIWIQLRDFSPDAIILVAASLTYAETIHFDHPNFPLQ